MFDKKYINKLISLYNCQKLFGKIIVLEGEQNLGQRETLQQLISFFKTTNIKCIDISYMQTSIPMSRVWESLAQYVNIKENFFGWGKYASYLSSNYSEFLFSQITNICKNEETIVFYSEDIMKCDSQLIRFLENIFEYIFSICNVIFIGCKYTDAYHNSDIETLLLQYCTKTEYVHFSRWDRSKLSQLFYDYFKQKIIIETNLLNRIISASFGNPNRLISLINYLKNEQIIHETENTFICNNFDEDFLFFKIQKYVLAEYNRLDSYMQDILRGSSVLGLEFNSVLLEKPLNFHLSERYLLEIEKITQFIYKKTTNIYEFCNQDTYLSIKKIVDSEEYVLWCSLLAKYYFMEAVNNINRKDCIEGCNFYLSSAYYYIESEQYNIAISVYRRVISILLSLTQYGEVLKVIRHIEELSQNYNIRLSFEFKQNLTIIKAYCMYSIFDFKRAANIYEHYCNNAIIDKLEMLETQCQYAICLYNTGETERPYNILRDIYDKSIKENVTQINAELAVDVLSYLSSIEETLCIDECSVHYNMAISYAHKYKLIDRYYSLLRKAFIAHSEKNCLVLLKTAKKYYEKTNNIKDYAMTLHNIASFTLLYGDIDDVKAYCLETIKIFKNLGSDGIHYTYNCLGVYWCMKGHFKKALKYFNLAYKDRYEMFSKIVILLNEVTVYQKLHYYKKAENVLVKIRKFYCEEEAISLEIIKPYYWLIQALFYHEIEKHETAYQLYLNYFSKEKSRNSYRLVLAAHNLFSLCEDNSYDFPDKLGKYLKYKSRIYDRLKRYNILPVHLAFAE